MKKKFFSIIFIFVMVCLLCPINVYVGFAYEVYEKEKNAKELEYFSNSKRSNEIYDLVINEYITQKEEENNITYTKDFAGVWIDNDGFLNLGVTNLNKASREYDEYVVYKPHTYSYNYLNEIYNEIIPIMMEYTIYMTGIDERANCVVICLNNEDDKLSIVTYLQEKDLYNEAAVNFVVNPDGKNTQLANTAYGGNTIANWFNSGTICANAIDSQTGKIGVLTNAHVAQTGTYQLNSSSGPTIGQASKSQLGGTIDAAFLPFENQGAWEVTPYTKYGSTTYTNICLGQENNIVQGNSIIRVGQTTGIVSGSITMKTSAVTVNGTSYSGIIQTTPAGQPGDSGGPIYYPNPITGNLYLIGMTFAEQSPITYACRISNVMSGLGVTPITNDSFNTTILTGNTVRLNGLNFNPSGAFVIPSSLNGRTVTEIANSAFANKTKITSITVPSSVTSIGNSAFSGCSSLTTVYIDRPVSQGVTTLGTSAFASCSALSSIFVGGAIYKTAQNWSAYSSKIKYRCDQCDGSVTYTTASNQHTAKCSNGHTKTESHSSRYTNYNNSTYHTAECMICGYYTTTDFHIFRGFPSDNSTYWVCSRCNYDYTTYNSPTRKPNTFIMKTA